MDICRIELVYTLIIMLGSMSFGATITFWSPDAAEMSAELGLSEMMGTIFNVLAPGGAIIGGLLTNLLSKVGRKLPLFGTAIVHSLGWAVIGLTGINFRILAFVMRTVVGVTTGIFSSICPLYITELAPADLRGVLGTFHQLGVMAGSTLTYLLGVFVGWRVLSYCLATLSFLLCCAIWFVIESPAVARQEGKRSAPLCRRIYLRPLAISALLMVFQQWSGINGVLANLESIFQQADSSLNPSIASFLVGLAGTIATGFASWFVESLGRRPSWIISSLAMCIAIVMTALCQYFKSWPRTLPVIFLFCANAAFGVGLGPIAWFLVPEFFPDDVRGGAMATMTAVNWIGVSSVVFSWPLMRRSIGSAMSFLLFGGVLFLSFLFGLFLMPETKGAEMGNIGYPGAQVTLEKAVLEPSDVQITEF
jgi:predicted MFS family arabinose efflux permease